MHPILHKHAEKIKPHAHMLVLGSVVVLIAAASFSLGYIYRAYSQKSIENTSKIQIEYPPYVTDQMKNGPYNPTGADMGQSTANAGGAASGAVDTAKNSPELASRLESTAGTFAASQGGKVYYPINCKALSRVKEENRIYFSSAAEAEELGLTLSKTCS